MNDAPTSILVGLIGAGIQPSLTPPMHEREGAAQGFAYTYRKIDLEVLGVGPEALPKLLAQAEREGFAGVNVTYPCKQSVIPLLHELSPDAAALGAVNTVLFRSGKRIGHNTDWWGFAESFRRGLPDVARDRVVQFGTGGAGAAVAHALLTSGVGRLSLVDTDHARAEHLARQLAERFGEGRAVACRDFGAAIAEADGVVNTTPVGMAKLPGTPFPPELLRPELWVVDIIYFPMETALLRAARALGCRTMSGAGMAVYQAVEAFRLFTGRPADAERMSRHFAEISAPR